MTNPTPVELLARELFAQHDNRPDRTETLQTILDELGLDVVKKEQSDERS